MILVHALTVHKRQRLLTSRDSVLCCIRFVKVRATSEFVSQCASPCVFDAQVMSAVCFQAKSTQSSAPFSSGSPKRRRSSIVSLVLVLLGVGAWVVAEGD